MTTKIKTRLIVLKDINNMIGIFVVIIIGFLLYAAGKETRFGGLGFLWRAIATIVVVFFLIMWFLSATGNL